MPDERADRACNSVNLTALGVPVELNVEGPLADQAVEALRAAWSWCLVEQASSAGPSISLSVYVDSDPDGIAHSSTPYSASSIEQLMHGLSPLVTAQVVAARAGQLLMFHAGAVADPRSGRTLAFVGPAGAGKTTAAITLGRHFSYVTDETVGVADDRRVVPYPKPLSVLEPGTAPLKTQICPDDLGLVKLPEDLILDQVVLLRRDPEGPNEALVESVGTVEALVELSPETSSLSGLDRPLHRLADTLTATGGLKRIRYREAEALVGVAHELLDARR